MKHKLILILSLTGLLITSCHENTEACVESMIENGYNRNDAQSACEDAAVESQIRE